MLRCEEVAQLIGSDTLAQAPMRTRLAVRLHLTMCRQCDAYAQSLQRIAETARRLAQGDREVSDARADAIVEAVRRRAEEQR